MSRTRSTTMITRTGIAFFCILTALVVGGSQAQAEPYKPTINCGPKVVGQKHAIFVRNDVKSAHDVKTGEPTYGDEKCVLVSEKANFATFTQIANSGLYLQSWKTNDACIQEFGESNKGMIWREPGCIFFDKKAFTLWYYLNKWNVDDERLRYRIETPGGGDTYLYFVGMYQYTPEQETNIIKEDTCSSLVEGLDCEKNKEKCDQECKKTGDCLFVANQCKSILALNKQEMVDEYIEKNYHVPAGYVESGGILPPCVFDGSCRNVNDFFQLGINAMKYLFTIIGSLALLAFVYGGFTMVLSMGNAEIFKKGQSILGIAVMGLVIAFSAYLLIDFILDAFGVAGQLKVIK